MRKGNFCGCCGNVCAWEWCEKCKLHVLGGWERQSCTYLAQFGKPCPYQVRHRKGTHNAKPSSRGHLDVLG